MDVDDQSAEQSEVHCDSDGETDVERALPKEESPDAEKDLRGVAY
jgi:hypothetical protein